MTSRTELAPAAESQIKSLTARVAELERELALARTAQPGPSGGAPSLSMAVAHAPVVLWAIDCNGVFTLSEGAGLAGIGLRPGEVVGRNLFEMYRDVPEVGAAVRKALAGEELTQEVAVGERVFKGWYSPLRDAEGQITGATGVATDITENVRAQRALGEAEEKLRSILDNVPDDVFTLDRQGRILSINRIGPKFTPEQVHGTPVESFVAPEHRERLRQAIDSVFKTGRSAQYEVLGDNGAGQLVWHSCRIGPIREHGEIVAVAGCATDITERRRAEEELQKVCNDLETRVGQRTAELIAANRNLQREIEQRVRAEARSQRQAEILQSVLDSMGDGLLVADQQERLLIMNPAAARMLEVDQSAAADSNWSWFQNAYLPDMVTPYPANERPIMRAIRGESIASEEIFFRNPGRTSGMWVQVSAQPLKDEHGVQQGGVVVFRDVTEHKRADAALRKAEERLQAFLDNTPSIIYFKDLQGRYLLTNRALQRQMQRTNEQFAGRTDLDLFPPEFAAAFRANDEKVLQSRRAFEFEERGISDGEMRTFLSVKFPLCNPQGEPYALCGISTDITQRKQAEQHLRAEQQFLRQLIHAHERDRQLMAYEIHDGLVQYMSAALMHLERIHDKKDKLTSKSAGALELAVHLIRRSINEGRRVMSGLRPPILDEAGIVLAIAYLINEQTAPSDLNIDFTHRVSFDRLEPLLEGTIFRIVQEALTNIKRHSKARRATVKLAEREGKVLVEVRDDGVGFDRSQVSKDRFGLEGICKRAELMGGQASIESAPGSGTKVSVELPLSPPVG